MKTFPGDLIQDGGGRQHPKDHGAAPRSLKNPQGLQGETSGRGGKVCRTYSIAGTTKTKKKKRSYGKILFNNGLKKSEGTMVDQLCAWRMANLATGTGALLAAKNMYAVAEWGQSSACRNVPASGPSCNREPAPL